MDLSFKTKFLYILGYCNNQNIIINVNSFQEKLSYVELYNF